MCMCVAAVVTTRGYTPLLADPADVTSCDQLRLLIRAESSNDNQYFIAFCIHKSKYFVQVYVVHVWANVIYILHVLGLKFVAS